MNKPSSLHVLPTAQFSASSQARLASKEIIMTDLGNLNEARASISTCSCCMDRIMVLLTKQADVHKEEIESIRSLINELNKAHINEVKDLKNSARKDYADLGERIDDAQDEFISLRSDLLHQHEIDLALEDNR